VIFWDVYGSNGHPVRATISDMGRCSSAAMRALNETQEGVLAWCSRSRTQRTPALDLKDSARDAAARRRQRGAVRTSTAKRLAGFDRHIQRASGAREPGAAQFFGEPMLDSRI